MSLARGPAGSFELAPPGAAGICQGVFVEPGLGVSGGWQVGRCVGLGCQRRHSNLSTTRSSRWTALAKAIALGDGLR